MFNQLVSNYAECSTMPEYAIFLNPTDLPTKRPIQTIRDHCAG